MDFLVMGLDGLVGSSDTTGSTTFASLANSDTEAKQKWYGSGGFLKQGRSGTTTEDDYFRSLKLSKTESSMLVQQRNSLLKSNLTLFTTDGQQQQMLSFSSPKSDAFSVEKTSQLPTLPYFHLTSSAYSRNSGHNSGSFSGGSMHGVFTETRGPFTQSQWMELEHQALIYKYITANVPIPSSLLIPIRKAVDSAGFSGFSGGFLRPNTLPWGGFHLGFSNNADPEPGRCRRTDGKKWRCSRDAVVDQKYCERHMNRGRHRSRKPVEGQSGQSAAATNSGTKSMLTACSTSASVVGSCSGVDHKSLTLPQHQLQPAGSIDISTANPLGRMFQNKVNAGEGVQDIPGLSLLSSNADFKSKENPFSITKQHSQHEDSVLMEFGLVTSDSLLNPSQKASSVLSCLNFGSAQNLSSDQETVSQHSFRQFMDDWPKTQSDRSAVPWPEVDSQAEKTQLSISIPIAPADFMSSTSSPNHEKTTPSPLRLSGEFDAVQMGLGVGSVLNEANQRQASWIPISWESSMGGPLGEVLHNTNNSAAECKNSSALNLMLEGWDSTPKLSSSPTGVLQKTTFGSLSNSSTGSSPRAENSKPLQ